MTADRFNFGVRFEDMTPVQRRVHNRRAIAHNQGIPVESTDELCALELDFPDWNVTDNPKGVSGVEVAPGTLVADHIRPSFAREFRLTASSIAELRVKLAVAEEGGLPQR
jgi:hypothetical protein